MKNLFSTPIAEGTYKGVKWNSMTTKEEIRCPQLQSMWEDAMKYKELFRSDHISHSEVCKIVTGLTPYEFIQSPLDRLKLYRNRAKYLNNKTVKL